MLLTPVIPKNLIVIAGPTAVGKTSVSIKLAKKLSAAVISADSRQMFRETVIGTAAPSCAEMNGVPHYFIGNLSIHDYYNVSRYEKDVNDLLEKLFVQHDTVILSGGSGMYIDAVCNGIDDLPDPDPALRKELNDLLEQEGILPLQEKLQKLDPEFYATADIMNAKRLIRAIEVCLATGSTYSSLRVNKKKETGYRLIKIALEREKPDLLERINARLEQMLNNGFLEEARSLYPFRTLNALNTVGYKELFAYFDGTMTLEEAKEKIKTNTWRYAKRQLTWLRKDKEYQWFHAEQEEEIIRFVESKIN